MALLVTGQQVPKDREENHTRKDMEKKTHSKVYSLVLEVISRLHWVEQQ